MTPREYAKEIYKRYYARLLQMPSFISLRKCTGPSVAENTSCEMHRLSFPKLMRRYLPRMPLVQPI